MKEKLLKEKLLKEIISFIIGDEMIPVKDAFVDNCQRVAHKYHVNTTDVIQYGIDSLTEFLEWYKGVNGDGKTI